MFADVFCREFDTGQIGGAPPDEIDLLSIIALPHLDVFVSRFFLVLCKGRLRIAAFEQTPGKGLILRLSLIRRGLPQPRHQLDGGWIGAHLRA